MSVSINKKETSSSIPPLFPDRWLCKKLVQSEIITTSQLASALLVQNKRRKQNGKLIPLARIITESGLIHPELPLNLNHKCAFYLSHFLTAFFNFLFRLKTNVITSILSPRIPIWLQLSIAAAVILSVSTIVLSYIVIERQREKLYDQTIKLGMVSLNYFSTNAKIPLLSEDILELNTLINNAATVEGHLYAFIIDNKQTIKAHTDHAQIDKAFKPFKNVNAVEKIGAVTYFTYTLPDKQHVLNLSMPITFKEKILGEVHVGLSTDFIRDLFISERSFLAFITLIIILFGMVLALLFSLRFSRPISKLVMATNEISKGNYNYKVQLNRTDELGDLAKSFNQMGADLLKQSLMKEYFGKYVGPDILEMIMTSPSQGRLKGRKTQATILFADIRGFTAYSESKPPEEVVEKLNEFFEISTTIILKHGGYVDKFIGDSVLAIFGIPIFTADHTEKCANAAVDMQKAFSENAKGDNTLLNSIGIGIASGEVLAGNIGSQAKTEYTVIGDCVNIASYLNSLAGPGEIIIGGKAGKMCCHFMGIDKLPSEKIKGREEKVSIYKVKT